ncbi:unnamed protein product [Onchocerca flexuosa]|uniref:Uncharacterized protein n=1 Tax=Onchocerca flexuosa TaxID=387005 RepID=A0A183HUQ4_9BILA|nr:unnamed protein product [Onchocerca flexuosa]
MGTIEEGEKIDHHYVLSPTDIENRDMVKEKTNDELENSDDNRQSIDMPVLPLLTFDLVRLDNAVDRLLQASRIRLIMRELSGCIAKEAIEYRNDPSNSKSLLDILEP